MTSKCSLQFKRLSLKSDAGAGYADQTLCGNAVRR